MSYLQGVFLAVLVMAAIYVACLAALQTAPASKVVVRKRALPVQVREKPYRAPWGLKVPRDACAGHRGVLVVTPGVLSRPDIVTCKDHHTEHVRVTP